MAVLRKQGFTARRREWTRPFSIMPAIQSLKTALGDHSNHDVIETARIIRRPPDPFAG
jgi:hypothetical protein